VNEISDIHKRTVYDTILKKKIILTKEEYKLLEEGKYEILENLDSSRYF
jgi:hypothetical protein